MEEQRNRITNPAFREGILEALGYKVDDLPLERKDAIVKDVEENWWFCGGRDTRPTSDTPCPYNTQIWERVWRHQFGERSMPNATEFCVCRQDDLRYNLYITDGQRILVIGSRCMYQFLPKVAKQVKEKRCELCMNVHKNRRDNYCDDCRIVIKEREKRRVVEEYEQKLAEQARRNAEEAERQTRVCECGMEKAPHFPQCYHCHQRKMREQQERLKQMTPQQRKAIECACGKPKQPHFPTCWSCWKR